jgi:hypothetical protein
LPLGFGAGAAILGEVLTSQAAARSYLLLIGIMIDGRKTEEAFQLVSRIQ